MTHSIAYKFEDVGSLIRKSLSTRFFFMYGTCRNGTAVYSSSGIEHVPKPLAQSVLVTQGRG